MPVDQASALRRWAEQAGKAGPGPEARVVAVTSGKGGVGKTTVAVNLAARLALMGRRVLLLDADLGLANADVICGVGCGSNLAHVVAGRCTLAEATVDAPGGFSLIRGASGLASMATLSSFERSRLLESLHRLVSEYDLVIVDTAAGIGPNVLGFLEAADDVLVMTTPEPTALTDAYGLIKVLSRSRQAVHVSLLVNMVRDAHEARGVFERVDAVCRRFLGLVLQNAGYLLQDGRVGQAVRYRKLFVLSDPASPAGQCMTRLAHRIDREATEQRGRSFFRRVASWLAG